MSDSCDEGYAMPAETERERQGHLSALAEIEWLIANSDGVAGLQIDGGTMPWHRVKTLYLPSWRP